MKLVIMITSIVGNEIEGINQADNKPFKGELGNASLSFLKRCGFTKGVADVFVNEGKDAGVVGCVRPLATSGMEDKLKAMLKTLKDKTAKEQAKVDALVEQVADVVAQRLQVSTFVDQLVDGV